MTPAFVPVLAKFWILDPLYTVLGTLVAWFYDIVPSFGVAIILLTIVVRLITFPLTAKQARSQQELQRHQPEIKRLQAKYKGDKQKLNEEMMKFYKENHVNPFGGCLPLLVQFPVLIVLYRLILDLTHKPPKHIPTSSSMYAALRESGGKMVSWGMDLSRRAAEVTGSDKIPFILLVAAVMATGYYQQRQLTARLPKESANSQMAVMGKVFPVIFGFISWTIPAGVVVYFLISNVWQVGQQAYMFRNQPKPESTDKAAGKKKGGTPAGARGSPPKAGKAAKGEKGGKATKGMTTTRGAKGAKGGGPASTGNRGNARQRPSASRNQPGGGQASKGRKPSSNRATPPKADVNQGAKGPDHDGSASKRGRRARDRRPPGELGGSGGGTNGSGNRAGPAAAPTRPANSPATPSDGPKDDR